VELREGFVTGGPERGASAELMAARTRGTLTAPWERGAALGPHRLLPPQRGEGALSGTGMWGS